MVRGIAEEGDNVAAGAGAADPDKWPPRCDIA